MDIYQIIYWKSLSMILMNYILVRRAGYHVTDVPSNYRNLVVFRVTTGFMAVQGIWGCVQYIPVSIGHCLYATGPLLVAVFARIWLKERLSKFDIMAIIMAFVGVILINYP